MDERIQVVLAVLSGALSLAEAARRHGGVAWFGGQLAGPVCGCREGRDGQRLAGPHGGQSMAERRLRVECGQLKLALAEATVQLRIWQKGAYYIDQVPSPTSRP